MNRVAERQVALLRHLVRAGDHQLHHEHEQEDRRDLEEEREIDPVTVARPEPRNPRGAGDADEGAEDEMNGLAQLHQEQRRLDAFAADHQQREEEYAEKRRSARLHARLAQMALDVALHPAPRAPHVHDHPRDRHRGNHRERSVEPNGLTGFGARSSCRCATGFDSPRGSLRRRSRRPRRGGPRRECR